MLAPRLLSVARGVADLRAEPREDAELVDQVHYGELLTLLASRGAWSYVQAEDHYFGWIHGSSAAAQATPATASRVVAVALADIYEQPDASGAAIDRLPAGTGLRLARRSDRPGWVALADGRWVRSDDTVSYDELPRRAPTAADLIATAEAFLGVPYLWGGTTALGIDCSGYVQQVYRLNGTQLDRDADQQAMEGRPVEEARAGDLLFFGKDRITHVALSTGGEDYLNAPERGRMVERGSFSRRAPLFARRYLPDPE